MHAGNGDPERDRRQDQRRAPARSGREPQRQAGRSDGDRHAGGDVDGFVNHMRAGIECAHADVMHGKNAAAHQAGRQRQPLHRQRPGAGRIDRPADHDRADQERQQCRQHQVVDLERQLHRKHADKVHGPDGDGERDGGAGQKQPATHAGCLRNLHGKAQADIGALDRHDDRKQDEPSLVGHRHCRHPFAVWDGRFHPIGFGTTINEICGQADSSSVSRHPEVRPRRGRGASKDDGRDA